jgi:transcriptional regulator with XRE-family HTH domain
MPLAMKARELGETVKRLREARGWTQTELARRAGLTQGYIAKLETPGYVTSPSLDVALQLAEAFGMDIGELVNQKTTRRRA